MFRCAIHKFSYFLFHGHTGGDFRYSPRLLNKKGVALLMVLSMLLIVVFLAHIVLGLVSSQSRLTHHQVSRIQAYYSAFAGMNLAFERLRTGFPVSPNPASYKLCSSGCLGPNDVNDANIVYNVTINIGAPNATGIRGINVTADYALPP